MSLTQYISEAISSSQYLYHFTTDDKLDSILSSNTLIGSEFGNPDDNLVGVSTTRNKNLNYDNSTVKITLDKNKLKHNYKIIPYDYWQRDYNVPNNPQTVDEDEEIILTPRGYVKNIKNYIIKVDNI